MIVTDRTGVASGVRAEAGAAAERNMAFYLHRAFAEPPDVLVFNDLRLARGGERAQIDHLILFRHGIFIIESKSVKATVRFNAHGEWERQFKGRWGGMASPIEQARRQGELLRGLLNDHKADLREKKALGLVQGGFANCPIGIVVAISDGGRIERGKADLPEVMKADMVVPHVRAEMERHARAARLTGHPDGDYGLYAFSERELKKIREFLEQQNQAARQDDAADLSHTPATPAAEALLGTSPPHAASQPAEHSRPAPVRPPSPPFTCLHCNSPEHLRIQWGGHNYFFRCGDAATGAGCGKATPIPMECARCGAGARGRKQGNTLWRVCAGCGLEERIWG